MVQSNFKIPECVNTKVKLKQLVLAKKNMVKGFIQKRKKQSKMAPECIHSPQPSPHNVGSQGA